MSLNKESFSEKELVFLQKLRSQTAPQHQRLEQNPLSMALMNSAVSLRDYANYLSAMYRVIEYSENVLFPVVNGTIDTSSRHKIPALDKDLSYLKARPVDQKFSVSGEITLPAALGYLYVIEGSTLGGRVIIKHLQHTLPVDEEQGAAFFAGYGNDTGGQWTLFLKTLIGYAAQNAQEDIIVTSAIKAFASIDQFFSINSAA